MILFGTSSGDFGGIQRVCRHIRRILKRQDIAFREVIYKPEGGWFSKMKSRLKFTTIVRDYIQRDGLLLFSHINLLKALSDERIKARVAVLVHGIELDTQLPVDTYRLLNKADYIFCNSKFTEQRVGKMVVNGDIRQVYYPGLNPDEFPHVKRQESAAPLVLMVGRMASTERYKGHQQVLEAWPQVIARHSSARLVFAGSGDDIDYLKKKAAKLEIQDSVEFRLQPGDDELAELYAQSWLKVLPSTREGQGLVFTEAMGFGVPVLALAKTVAEEFIDHRENGLLAGSRNAHELAEHISFAIKNSDWRKQAGIKALDKVKELDLHKKFESELLSIIREDVECVG